MSDSEKPASNEEVYQWVGDNSDDDEMDYANEDMFALPPTDVSAKSKRLLPDSFDSIKEALSHFAKVFVERYAIELNFRQTSLKTAYLEAIERDLHNRKPLAVYLHNDLSATGNFFIEQILCDKEVSTLLNEKFVLWGWDCTKDSNRQSVIGWLKEIHASDVASIVESAEGQSFPLIFVLDKVTTGPVLSTSLTLRTVAQIRPHEDGDVVLAKLLQCVSQLDGVKLRDLIIVQLEQQNCNQTPPIPKKLVIVGDRGVGKTSQLMVYAKDQFSDVNVPTAFESHVVDVVTGGKKVALSLWDPAGRTDNDLPHPFFYADTDIVLMCFSIDSPLSLENITQKWIKEVRQYCPNVPIILVGNKKDLRGDPATDEQQKFVTSKQGQDVADQIDASTYLECSAKTREGVSWVFLQAARRALKHQKSQYLGYV